MQLLHLPLELLLMVLSNFDTPTLATFLATSKTVAVLLPLLLRAHPTLLHAAAAQNHAHILPQLLQHIPVTALDQSLRMPICVAASANALAALRLLLPLSPATATAAAFDAAAAAGHLPALSLLLPHTICVSRALELAAANAHPHIVARLLYMPLSHRALTTALSHAAAAKGGETVVPMLLERTSGRLPDDTGMTPLCWAARNGRVEAVRLLVGRGNVDAQDWHGWTALHWAGLGGQEEVVRVLLAAGADLGVRNDQGCSAGEWIESTLDIERW